MNVAKLATDGKKRLRHKRRAMPKYPIKRDEFTALRKAKGYSSDSALWRAVIASGIDVPVGEDISDRSQLSKTLNNKRTAKAWEISAMARLLEISKDKLMIVLGIDPKERMVSGLVISGTIKEGGTIMLASAGLALRIEETYSDAAYAHRGKLLRVDDNSMGERYRQGDLVEYGDPQTNFDAHLRQPVVVRFKDGRVMLRLIHASDRVGFYTFLPVHPTAEFEPITTDSIDWIADIEAIFPPKR